MGASSNYTAAYTAAIVADNAYADACVTAYGTADSRWRKHTDATVLAAQGRKFAADQAMHAALKALHAVVLS